MIDFDHATTTRRLSPEIIEAAQKFLLRNYDGLVMPVLADAMAVFQVRSNIAKWLKCRVDRIVLTTGATESLNVALRGQIGASDRVVAMATSHNAVLEPLRIIAKTGSTVDFAGLCSNTVTNYAELISLVRLNQPDQAQMVVLTHGSNLTGEVAPLEWLLAELAGSGVKIVCDCAQTAGVIKLPPLKSQSYPDGVDAIAFSGHKWLGGLSGVGVLALADDFCPQPVLVGGGGGVDQANIDQFAPEIIEVGTRHGVATAVLGTAVARLRQMNLEEHWQNLQMLRRYAFKRFQELADYEIFHCDSETSLPIISLRHRYLENAIIAQILFERAMINSRYGLHCAPLVHKHLQTDKTGLIRFSFDSTNTTQEIDCLIENLTKISRIHGS